MEQQEKIKDSPFYVEYTGKIDDHWTITTTESFKKALAKHLQDKYPNEKNPQGKHNFSKCVRFILENYLNLQCISRKTYNYNVVVIVSDDNLGTENIYVYGAIKSEKNRERILTGDSRKLYWANVNEKALNERYDYDDLSEISKLVDMYKTNFDSDGVLLVDLPLNNFFDEYADGIYSADAENKALHCGVNTITTSDKIYCIVYEWYINHDYKPTIHSMGFEDLDTTMQDLLNVNKKAYINFEKAMNVHEKYVPKDEVERLKKQNKKWQEDIAKFEDAIKFAKEHIDANNSRLDELTK